MQMRIYVVGFAQNTSMVVQPSCVAQSLAAICLLTAVACPACLSSSSGTFEGTHLGDWYEDTRAIMTQFLAPQHAGKKVIVGESNSVAMYLQLLISTVTACSFHPAS
jgi:hypothetical protein